MAQILIEPETFYIQRCFSWQLRISVGCFPDGMSSVFDLYCEGRKWIFKLSVCCCGLLYLLLVKQQEELNVLVSVAFRAGVPAARLRLCNLDLNLHHSARHYHRTRELWVVLSKPDAEDGYLCWTCAKSQLSTCAGEASGSNSIARRLHCILND